MKRILLSALFLTTAAFAVDDTLRNDKTKLGNPNSAANKVLEFNVGTTTNPFVRFNTTTSQIEYSDDGSIVSSFATGALQGITSTIASTFTIGPKNTLVLANASAINQVFTLYSAIGNHGRTVTVKKIDNTNNTVTLQAVSGQVLDSVTSFVINNLNQAISLVADTSIPGFRITGQYLTKTTQQVSGSSGAFSTSSTSLVDVTNLSVTITTTGRPVMVVVQPNSSTSAKLGFNRTSSSGNGFLDIVRNGTTIKSTTFAYAFAGVTSLALSLPLFITVMDFPSAGTYTYKVQARVLSGTSGEVISVNDSQLVVFEI